MCPDYAGFLIRYCFYMGEKKAVETNATYAMPQMLEGMYDEVKRFYTGVQRDFALYTLMCNFIRNGKQVERVMPLYKEYKRSEEHTSELQSRQYLVCRLLLEKKKDSDS